ncbi:MAG: hypothetical protein C0399_12765 [Syntrophus sp. (in: bacteria)]|nr:hypothetical protein [Syntrophus sp. (in: bacteria)]MBA4419245.1 hypothetical protein [Syntrophus sp. (in: bacteria)]
MKKHALALLLSVPLYFVISGDLGAAEPKGAKALFFSGEGTTVARTPVVPMSAPTRQAELKRR